MLAITHYARVLSELRADRVHVLMDGRIVASGGPELADKLEETGYEGLAAELGVEAPVEEKAERRRIRSPTRVLNRLRDRHPQTIVTGVPRLRLVASCSITSFGTRTQPCDTDWPIAHGSFVPWMPI